MAQGFFSVINPRVERFRGSTFPAQAQGDEPVDPFASRRPGVIYLTNVPETSSGSQVMTETLNPNAPEIRPELSTTIYPEEEETGLQIAGGGSSSQGELETIEVPAARIKAQERIRKKMTRNEFLAANDLGPLPANTKSTTLQQMRDYYKDFTQSFALDTNDALYTSKSGMYKEMVDNIDDLINLYI